MTMGAQLAQRVQLTAIMNSGGTASSHVSLGIGRAICLNADTILMGCRHPNLIRARSGH
jgi:hypothetical protein